MIRHFVVTKRDAADSLMISAQGNRSVLRFFTAFDDTAHDDTEERVTNFHFNDWLEIVPWDVYCRIHHAHIVHIPLIKDFVPDFDGHGGEIILKNGMRFRVSRKYLHSFHEATGFRFASAVQRRNHRQRKRKKRGGAENATINLHK